MCMLSDTTTTLHNFFVLNFQFSRPPQFMYYIETSFHVIYVRLPCTKKKHGFRRYIKPSSSLPLTSQRTKSSPSQV